MNILEKIIYDKRKEVDSLKKINPEWIKKFSEGEFFDSFTFSLSDSLRSDDIGIIAEYKRKSPSKGIIKQSLNPLKVVSAYKKAGAAAVSVLTNEKYFDGRPEFISQVRSVQIPILRKEFIVDEYQVWEAKAIGADAILLIAECLETEEVANLSRVANELNLEVLLEIHSATQLEKITQNVQVIGVNNRNLETFQTDIYTSIELVDKLPQDLVKISESGISKASVIGELMGFGFDGFLIGEHFMMSEDPGKECAEMIRKIKLTELTG
jgi:indole-3-glycerol phosphate synthase